MLAIILVGGLNMAILRVLCTVLVLLGVDTNQLYANFAILTVEHGIIFPLS